MADPTPPDRSEVSEQVLLAALRESGAYPHPCTSISLIETHISWVFLTGEFAYKLKKPLDFGFLDFTTLARREHFCREELRLNAVFAPELYLDCVPITCEPDGCLRVGGSGEIVEYAVKMRQFDGAEQLDRVLERGDLEASMLREFAEHLAGVYASLPFVSDDTARFGAAHIAQPGSDNFRELERLCTDKDERAKLARVRTWTERFHQRLGGAFDERASSGCIRECHGDLHLRNLVRRGTEIRAFDCIEFSEELRLIDPVNDIAFLFMDLAVRGRDDLAYAFADSYFDTTGDYAGAGLLRYYAVYRALVRAKIAYLRLHQAYAESTARDARDHLAWAAGLADDGEAIVVLMCGVSGSGKSWLAERLAPVLQALRLRSDVARRAGTMAAAGVPATETAQRYSQAGREAVYERLLDYAQTIVESGERVIVDATFINAALRKRFAAMAKRLGVSCVVVHCSAARSCLEQRITRRRDEGADASEATLAVLEQQLERFELPGEQERVVEVATDLPLELEALTARIVRAAGQEA